MKSGVVDVLHDAVSERKLLFCTFLKEQHYNNDPPFFCINSDSSGDNGFIYP